MSTLKADTVQSTSGGAVTLTKQHAPKVWVNYDGTASGAAARDSFNVSGQADNGTGDYTTSFTNSMTNDDYASGFGTNSAEAEIHTLATSSIRASMLNSSGSNNDKSIVSYNISGDLA